MAVPNTTIHGIVQYCLVLYGIEWYVVVSDGVDGMGWYGMVWDGMVWDGMGWFGMVWDGMANKGYDWLPVLRKRH